jgi:hypothetical protein
MDIGMDINPGGVTVGHMAGKFSTTFGSRKESWIATIS